MRIGFERCWGFRIAAVSSVWNGLRVKKGVKPEVRYFISSLDRSKCKPADILALIREHWSMENNLHVVKDRWRDEGAIDVFVESGGQCRQLDEKRKEPLTAVAEGQNQKNPETTRIHKINETCTSTDVQPHFV